MSDKSHEIDLIPGRQDVFGTPTRNTLINVLDIASHYPYNPERLRLRVDGSRVFPEYGSVSQYNHAGPEHELKPAQDETVVMQTAERPRYAVGFEQIATFAFNVSRSLESNDQLRVGLFDDNDGWFIEHNPNHADDQVDLVIREGGSDTTDVSGASLEKPLTNFHRYELRTAWYRVTRQLWRQSTATDGEQNNTFISNTSSEGGPETGNLPLRFEVTRGSSSSAITLNAGSVSLLTQGDRTDIRRVTTHEVSFTTDGSNADGSTWIPQYALRVDPNREIIDTQMTNIRIVEYNGNDDVRVLLQAHDSSKVNESDDSVLDDADFNTPEEHSSQNSALQESFAVTQAADNDGSITGSTANSTSDNPGGYQVGYASRHSSGQGSKASIQLDAAERKRGIYSGDIIVLWCRADNTSVEVQVNITTEQDW